MPVGSGPEGRSQLSGSRPWGDLGQGTFWLVCEHEKKEVVVFTAFGWVGWPKNGVLQGCLLLSGIS